MDRLKEVSASTNNSSSCLIVIAEISQVVKESAFQPIFIAESSQVVKGSASLPNVIAESSQVQIIYDFKIPELLPRKIVLFLRKHLPQNITK